MTSIRDVEIVTLSARDELISVVRVAMAVTAVVWLYLANNPFPVPGDSVQRSWLHWSGGSCAATDEGDEPMESAAGAWIEHRYACADHLHDSRISSEVSAKNAGDHWRPVDRPKAPSSIACDSRSTIASTSSAKTNSA